MTYLPCSAQDTAGMGQEQAKERAELEKMHNEVKDIKGTINDAVNQLNDLGNQAAQAAAAGPHEYHLFAQTAVCEIAPGLAVNCFTYNGKIPGPPFHVQEGETVRLVLHNQLKVPTSLILPGMLLPQSISGLPRKDAGIVQPGQTYAYQFVARQSGTFWYHPQVINQDQRAKGMFGAFIVDPKSGQVADKEIIVLFSSLKYDDVSGHQAVTGVDSGRAYHVAFMMNGKSAPSIPAIELRQGERVKLRMINAAPDAIPIAISGHRFEVTAIDGSDVLEPRVSRDLVTLNPSDRIDVEFTADNPGVWSFASEIMQQATNNGSFPGGIACVIKYSGMTPGNN